MLLLIVGACKVTVSLPQAAADAAAEEEDIEGSMRILDVLSCANECLAFTTEQALEVISMTDPGVPTHWCAPPPARLSHTFRGNPTLGPG